jgi:hypothetical protein
MSHWLNLERRLLIAVLVMGSAGTAMLAADHSAAPGLPGLLSPRPPASQELAGDEVFAKLLDHNRQQDADLLRYTTVLTYQVSNDQGKVYAQEVVNVQYEAPGRRDFVMVSEEGSSLVRHLVLKRLMEGEKEAASGREHHNSFTQPSNHAFFLTGEQDSGPYHCYVVQAIPWRADRYVFVGNVWINTEDFGIVRIEGQPARSLSFRITRADFVREYQKIGEFWLPAKDETHMHMRLYENEALAILRQNYTISSVRYAAARVVASNRPANGR